MRNFLLLSFIFLSLHSSAQKIHGIVFNEKGDLLPYSSITIKGTTTGASANNRAKYSISVKPGRYTVVCQHIGYAAREKDITIADNDEELVFILKEQKYELKEVVVKSGGEDPAYAIIRSAIKKRPEYSKEVNTFTCDLYTKDLIKLRRLPKKVLGQTIPDADRQDMMLDTTGAGIIYLAESVAKVAAQQPDKVKLEVVSSRVSGSDGFGFTFPTFISLYNNNVIIFTQKLNPRGFISPIADGALAYYRYKYLGSFWENGKEINSIRVTPRRSYEPLFSGIINITENDWRIHSLDLTLTKKSQLEIIDTLQITQFHVPAGKEAWRVKNQLIHFSFSQFGIDAVGNFVNVYSGYDINPPIAKNFFDNVIIKYDSGVNGRPKTYWDTMRPMPLEREEARDYVVKDSMFQVHKDSAKSQLTADVLNAKQGKIEPIDIFWRGIRRTHYSTEGSYNWSVDPLVRGLEYNLAEGVVVNLAGSYDKYLKQSKTNLSITPSLRYGFSNKHLNGALEVMLRTRDFEPMGKLKRETWTFAGGRRVTQFNKESPISPLLNTISTLLYGDNLMKTYENAFGSTTFSKRYENGLRLSINALFEDRKPLDNTTDFIFNKKDTVHITPNYPSDKIRQQFTPHKALIMSLDVSFKPGQKYIQYPDRKIPIGSKYPTLSLNYTKGIKSVFGSDVDFDKWKFTVSDEMNFRIAGLLKYKIGAGGFLNSNQVFIQDYQHFNGNQTAAASEYVNSYQLVSYYAFSTNTNLFSFAHLEHHFNGLLTNKLPLFRRLNWHLVGGANAFYVNADDNHLEIFAGLENILKIFRVDLVWGFNRLKNNQTAIRIGFGGLIGGNIRTDRRSGSVSLSF
ncbi:MAG: DUF5686 and carboxypeptidase regulatory-like domain-containing protein [Ferruginibacter sp.]